MKTKGLTKKLFLVAIFILVISFGLGREEKVEAKTSGTCTFTAKKDVSPNGHFKGYINGTKYKITDIQAETCRSACQHAGIINENDCLFNGKGWFKWNAPVYETINNDNIEKAEETDDVCGGTMAGIRHPIKCLLLYVLRFLGILLSAAASLFVIAVDPDVFKQAVGYNDVIYETWAIVRDVLNISFIMFLLFSAFATVFQIEKYNYKKTLLMVVLMALLVNFSFPIARFIIDISNMMMYYFIDALNVNSSSLFAQLAKNSAIHNIIYSSSTNASTSSLLAAVIFIFIFTITLVTIAVLLIIRIVALGILIIFSSLAFVGAAIPPLSSYASDWWKKLFSYSFFGPIMIFMIYISLKMMTATKTLQENQFGTAAVSQSSTDPSGVAAMAYFAIPISILWLGLGIAQSMSITGASIVVGKAQGVMKGAGKWTAKAPWRGVRGGAGLAWKGTKMAAKQTGIPGGLQQKWQNWKKTKTDNREAKEARIAEKGHFAVPNALDQSHLKRIEEAKKNLNINDLPETSLKNILRDPNKNKFEKTAARQKLAELGSATQNDLDEVRKAFGETSQVFMQLANKVKLYDPVAAFSHLSVADQKTNFDDFTKSNQFDSKKINSNSWQNEAFMESALVNGEISDKEMEEVLKKNPTKATNIKMALTGVTDNHTANTKIDKKIQLINFARTGSISPSALNEKHIQDYIFSRLNGENGANIDLATAKSYTAEIFANIKPGKLTDFARNIKNDKAQKEILAEIKHIANSATHPQNKIYQQHAKTIKKDASLAGAYEAA